MSEIASASLGNSQQQPSKRAKTMHDTDIDTSHCKGGNIPVADPTCVSQELTEFLSHHMASFKCPAHDVKHCYRVGSLALDIAKAANTAAADTDPLTTYPSYDLRVVYLAGLLHDILDSKLVSSSYSEHATTEEHVIALLKSREGMIESKIADIMCIVKNIGYKNLIKPGWDKKIATFPAEYQCVQDADLLDAIGSIGLTRVFSYGGRKNRPIFGFTEAAAVALGINKLISAEEYATRAGSGIEHFFDKLLRIRLFLNTPRGVELGDKRHFRMVSFLRDIDEELTEARDAEAGRITALLADPSVTVPRV